MFVVPDPRVFLPARCVGVGASSDMLPDEFRSPAMWFLSCRMRAWAARQDQREIENPRSAQRLPTPAQLHARHPRRRLEPATTRAAFEIFHVFEVKVGILKSQNIFSYDFILNFHDERSVFVSTYSVVVFTIKSFLSQNYIIIL